MHPFVVVNVVEVRTFRSSAGKEFRLQSVLFARGDGAIFPVDVFLGPDESPYTAGRYAVSSASFGAGDRGRIEFRLQLGPRIEK